MMQALEDVLKQQGGDALGLFQRYVFLSRRLCFVGFFGCCLLLVTSPITLSLRRLFCSEEVELLTYPDGRAETKVTPIESPNIILPIADCANLYDALDAYTATATVDLGAQSVGKRTLFGKLPGVVLFSLQVRVPLSQRTLLCVVSCVCVFCLYVSCSGCNMTWKCVMRSRVVKCLTSRKLFIWISTSTPTILLLFLFGTCHWVHVCCTC